MTKSSEAVAHAHTQAPADPADGDTFACECGVAYEYVVLEDGYAEWVQVTSA
jgi:hypothetical protein